MEPPATPRGAALRPPSDALALASAALLSLALFGCRPPCADGYGRDNAGNCVPLAPQDTGDSPADTSDGDTSAEEIGPDDTGPDTDVDDTGPDDTGPDSDGDGYGSEDCDDGDAGVHPHAPEVLGDGVDQNCDGRDEVDAEIGGANSGAYLGYAAAGVPDLDGDGRDEILVGAPNHSFGLVNQGGAWLLQGSDEPNWSLDDAAAVLAGPAEGDRAAISLAAGDVTGDGVADLLIGAQHHETQYTNDGGLFVLSGATVGASSALDAPDALLYGPSGYLYTGWSSAFAGDIDGDGIGDALVGAPQGEWGQPDIYGAGYAFLAYGPLDGERPLDESGAEIEGDLLGNWTGYAAAGLGDVDGDGLNDFAITSVLADDVALGAANAGRVSLFLDAPAGGASITDADAQLLGEDTGVEGQGTRAGWGLSRGGDVDGDGYADLLIGGPQGSIPDHSDGGNGLAWLVSGAPDLAGEFRLLDVAAARLEGAAYGDRFGMSVAGGLDANGDGHDDVAVGAPHASISQTLGGAAYLFLGPLSGALSAEDAALTLHGEQEYGALGWSLAGADVDGDGLDDLLIGATNEDSESGALRVILGDGLF